MAANKPLFLWGDLIKIASDNKFEKNIKTNVKKRNFTNCLF